MLVVFGGLPGTGKTTIARELARRQKAVYLRIDAIEQALRSANVLAADVGPAGYMIAYALAETNLRLGLTVVADSVNPLSVTRSAWRAVARAVAADLIDVEVICSDAAEHRRRVESRAADIEGLTPPGWADVMRREYQPWHEPRLVLDTAVVSPDEACAELCAAIEARERARCARRPA